MGCCSSRTYLLFICIVQLISTILREIFDFLGYMWAPIIGNFLQILCIILGIFGIHHFRPKYLGLYGIWSLIWLGWNIFIVCFYLEIGDLKEESDILSIGTGSRSWWAENGLGCLVLSNYSLERDSNHHLSSQFIRVENCLVDYHYVEIIQAGVQCLFAILGFLGASYIIYRYSEEDDSFDFIGGFDSYKSYHSPTKGSHIHLQPIYEEKQPRSSV